MDRMELHAFAERGRRTRTAAHGSTRLRCMRPHGLRGRMAVVEYLRCDEGIKALDVGPHFPAEARRYCDSRAGARCARTATSRRCGGSRPWRKCCEWRLMARFRYVGFDRPGARVGHRRRGTHGPGTGRPARARSHGERTRDRGHGPRLARDAGTSERSRATRGSRVPDPELSLLLDSGVRIDRAIRHPAAHRAQRRRRTAALGDVGGLKQGATAVGGCRRAQGTYSTRCTST